METGIKKLAAEHCSLRDVQLDVVTFGTPIRYGWDLDGCTTLTHFVNHRPSDGFPEFLTCRPDLRSFTSGDMIHQLGIAGSDLLPSPFAWNNWKTERRLRKFIQVDCRGRDYWNNLSAGMRVAEDGFTWLVDYGNIDAELASQLFGHSVYTNSRWLSFHAHQIASRLNNPYSIRQEEIG